jgi:hypothetical protein
VSRAICAPFHLAKDADASGQMALPGWLAAGVCLAISLLSFLAYARALRLPLIADDYDQIARARNYAPVSGWAALFHDVSYRCRATSLFVTYWTKRWFGTDPFIFNLSSVLIHVVDALLVFALGFWRPSAGGSQRSRHVSSPSRSGTERRLCGMRRFRS